MPVIPVNKGPENEEKTVVTPAEPRPALDPEAAAAAAARATRQQITKLLEDSCCETLSDPYWTLEDSWPHLLQRVETQLVATAINRASHIRQDRLSPNGPRGRDERYRTYISMYDWQLGKLTELKLLLTKLINGAA